MQSERLRPYFFLSLLIGAIALTALIFRPFLEPLALAAVFAVVLREPCKRISKLLGDWPSVAALITVVASVLVILLPLALIGALVANEARDLFVSLESQSGRNAIAEFFLRLNATYGDLVPGFEDFSRTVSANIDTYARTALEWLVEHAGAIFSGISGFLLSLFIFFIALYYLLRDGTRVREALVKLSPLTDSEDEAILEHLSRAVNSVVKGSLMIALIQGALAGVGFALFGVPHAALWGTVTAVAALVPGIGTALVFLPAVAFLFITGSTIPAVGLLVWGTFAVGLIDNLLGPRLIGRGMRLHPLLILLAVLGGILFFGPVGVLLGPLSLSLLFALLTIYAGDSKEDSGSVSNSG
ncbi:AI-2E family transporter [Candidatus Kaiserbacteria bacterium]|nr:AI-2E family transporter [Candidatus Kaiserbacteria bacterium]